MPKKQITYSLINTVSTEKVEESFSSQRLRLEKEHLEKKFALTAQSVDGLLPHKRCFSTEIKENVWCLISHRRTSLSRNTNHFLFSTSRNSRKFGGYFSRICITHHRNLNGVICQLDQVIKNFRRHLRLNCLNEVRCQQK